MCLVCRALPRPSQLYSSSAEPGWQKGNMVCASLRGPAVGLQPGTAELLRSDAVSEHLSCNTHTVVTWPEPHVLACGHLAYYGSFLFRAAQ